MNYGPGWIILEESLNPHARRVLSILPPRRSPRDVSRYMEQLYVDRYYSIHERLQYKKQSRKSGSHHVRPIDGFNRNWHCGHDPIYLGHYAHQITLRGTMLEFFYRVAVINPDRSVRLEDRQQVLEVPT